MIVISCNSLAHLITADEIRACLACVRRHLVPHGTLAFDVINPDVRLLARSDDDWVPLGVASNAASPINVEEKATYDPIAQLRVSYWRIGDSEAQDRELAPLSLRQFFPQELTVLLERSGLRLAARFGDFQRGPLRTSSPNQICLARPG